MTLTLCRADEIPENGARGFELRGRRVFAVRHHGKVYVYLNRCPHLGVPLEWDKDRFLDPGGTFIRCSTHGAIFVKDSGECIQGPCRGEFLWSLECREDQGEILVDEEELPPTASPGKP